MWDLFEAAGVGLLSFFGTLIAKPLARLAFIAVVASLVSGFSTLVIVAICYVIYNWLLYLIKWLAIIGLFFSIFTLTCIAMAEDKDTIDRILVEPGLGWNVTRDFLCNGVRMVTDKPVWKCPMSLPSNMTGMHVIHVV